MSDNKVDIKENYIKEIDEKLLPLLLVDKTTNKNIIWAVDDYNFRGKGYFSNDQISVNAITGHKGNVIKPRTEKSRQEIKVRIKNKAEVFTPSWVCNAQNNLVDEAWFGYKFVFNSEIEKSWKINLDKIIFGNQDGKKWQDYVKANRMEITCGEAPYLVSRYDTVSGQIIPTKERIGLLDRKMRVINENTTSEQDWLDWTKIAYKSIYGFDWQGDNVLIARENLLFTFIDYYQERFVKMPSTELLDEIVEIITWNIWQMDGLKCVIPNSCTNTKETQTTLSAILGMNEKINITFCQGCKKNNIFTHNGKYCKIMDWELNKKIKFVNVLKEKKHGLRR